MGTTKQTHKRRAAPKRELAKHAKVGADGDGDWYVSSGQPLHSMYLHHDGDWYDWCCAEGRWSSKAKATKALDAAIAKAEAR